MLKLLLISSDRDAFNGFESAFKEHNDIDLDKTDSGENGLKMAVERELDLVIVAETLRDMSGLEFAGRLLSINPMINCALASSLSAEVFHEKSEGLGLMAQLSTTPDRDEAENLINSLRQLKKLLNET